ncbi:MAG: 2-amino-4-hydroxy-6-hydroxymethyldihydropteridine diphosphokinase [Candidatus Electryonea clarkiae]|nr:2-amino-4-hydroxy-6-hydroxymethyldihydropteridine diphosphokinase [Candidatus Electryonea clarkiae]MDP8285318.1 2-amino-4-hydroxy-6-hydroxymethyldihydropteridine diphosphokinase [Candidatus Electryonea clarkiae]
MKSVLVYLGLGGNVGDVRNTFAVSLQSLNNDPRCKNLRTSRLFQTEPWGLKDQPDFLNLCVELYWSGSLGELSDIMVQLERAGGRERSEEEQWGPRKLDIDILLFGDQYIKNNRIKIPHPRIEKRKFVLFPLADLAPEIIPTNWTKTIIETKEKCEDRSKVEALTHHAWIDWKK